MKNRLARIAACAEIIDGIFKLHPQRAAPFLPQKPAQLPMSNV
jgi:hypothetical protein